MKKPFNIMGSYFFKSKCSEHLPERNTGGVPVVSIGILVCSQNGERSSVYIYIYIYI